MSVRGGLVLDRAVYIRKLKLNLGPKGSFRIKGVCTSRKEPYPM